MYAAIPLTFFISRFSLCVARTSWYFGASVEYRNVTSPVMLPTRMPTIAALVGLGQHGFRERSSIHPGTLVRGLATGSALRVAFGISRRGARASNAIIYALCCHLLPRPLPLPLLSLRLWRRLPLLRTLIKIMLASASVTQSRSLTWRPLTHQPRRRRTAVVLEIGHAPRAASPIFNSA